MFETLISGETRLGWHKSVHQVSIERIQEHVLDKEDGIVTPYIND